jgi:hypothetical protein
MRTFGLPANCDTSGTLAIAPVKSLFQLPDACSRALGPTPRGAEPPKGVSALRVTILAQDLGSVVPPVNALLRGAPPGAALAQSAGPWLSCFAPCARTKSPQILLAPCLPALAARQRVSAHCAEPSALKRDTATTILLETDQAGSPNWVFIYGKHRVGR